MAHVLVVDDEPTHRELVETMLVRAHHTVVAAANGREGLAHLREGGVDLVVTDIFMPGINGLDLIVAIRALGSHVPIIGMTGGMRGDTRSYAERMTAVGACGVLIKPFGAEALLAAVANGLAPGPTLP